MNERTPTFRKHASGLYFTKWAGKNHYFSRDRDESYQAYLQSMTEWAQWRQDRSARFPPLRNSQPKYIAEVVEKFLEFKELEGGPLRRRYYANHLRRFANGYKAVLASRIRASHLQALKEDMLRQGYDPRTINHDLSCIKSLFNWASGMEIVPAVNLRFAKPLALAPTPDRSIDPSQVKEFLLAVPEHIRAWLALNYLALMRPSEVVRVVNGQGVWETPWLFRLHKGKMDERTQEHRRIVFSPAALKWMKIATPFCSAQDPYWKATARALDADHAARIEQARALGQNVSAVERLPYSPHILRHSAATHLAQQGASRSDIDLLLGHLPPRVSRTYVRIDWQSLRAVAGQLTLRLSRR